MSKERREGKGQDPAQDVLPAKAPSIGPGKRGGTSNAPAGLPPHAPGKRSLTQHFAPQATRAPITPSSIDELATNAVAKKAAGTPLDPTVRATMERHLGKDFGDVRVHEDPLSAASTKAMGARAFTQGKDIYLAPGESPTDMTLMAHELTHVVQQAKGSTQQPQRKVTVGPAGSPAEQQADAVAAGVTGGEKPPMLVDAGAPVQDGQMDVTQFMAALRAQVEGAAADKFGPLWSVTGCTYIEKYFSYYAGKSAKDIERAMKKYAPEAAASGNAQVAVVLVTSRVRSGMDTWEAKGELPPDAAAIAPPEAHEDAGEAQSHVAESAHAMHQCTAACKHAPGEHPTNPMDGLGEGAPLDGAVANRMGGALGADVSGVRVHTDEQAGEAAKEQRATAFAVGQDIAFAPGAYQPGTVEGDALLAHELAHTMQQKGADPTKKPGAESKGAEANADDVAAGALATMYGDKEGDKEGDKGAAASFGGSLASVMSTPLQLQRCSPENTSSKAPPAKAPSATGATKDLFAGAKAPDDAQKAAIDKILSPTGAGGAASQPYKRAGFKANMTTALDRWRRATTANFRALSGPNSFKLDMPQVRKTGEAAQATVVAKYGDYIKAGAATMPGTTGTGTPGYKVSDPAVLHPQEDSIDPLPVSDQKDVVIGLVSYAMQQPDGGKAVAEAHHVDLSRTDDQTDYYTLMNDYATAHFAELKKIQRDWPGEEHPWDGTVYVQLRREKDSALGAKEKSGDAKFADANLRRGYWSTFQTLIHEFIHAAAHKEWREAENAPGVPASKAHIMIEGTCEYFTERAYKDIEPKIPGDDALREQVEGKKYPWTPEVLPPWGGYDSRADVEQIVTAMGGNETNLRLAYFMGHIELIGLGKWKKEHASEAGNFEVLVDKFPLSLISERTFVSVDDIRAANKFPATQNEVAKGMIVVPGITYHHVVHGDNENTIAEQHGVTVAALKKANSHITNWTTLSSGYAILIPAH